MGLLTSAHAYDRQQALRRGHDAACHTPVHTLCLLDRGDRRLVLAVDAMHLEPDQINPEDAGDMNSDFICSMTWELAKDTDLSLPYP